MIIAVDTGGTKTLVASFATDGSMMEITKFPTPQVFEEYADLVTGILLENVSKGDVEAIVVAMPGTITDNRVSRFGNLPWGQIDIVSRISSKVDGIPVLVENDANLGGLGEARTRSESADRCLYVTVSTGIGGGFICNGTIDATLSRSELGSMILSHDNTFKKWENFASGKAMLEDYGKLASEISDEQDWREIAQNLSAGFLALLPIIRPDVVIFGGGVGAHLEKFGSYLSEYIADSLPEHYQCPLELAQHPEEAVVYGCYYYALDYLAAK